MTTSSCRAIPMFLRLTSPPPASVRAVLPIPALCRWKPGVAQHPIPLPFTRRAAGASWSADPSHARGSSAMTEMPISRFPVPRMAELPHDIDELHLAVQDNSGFVHTIYLITDHSTDEFRAIIASSIAQFAKSD